MEGAFLLCSFIRCRRSSSCSFIFLNPSSLNLFIWKESNFKRQKKRVHLPPFASVVQPMLRRVSFQNSDSLPPSSPRLKTAPFKNTCTQHFVHTFLEFSSLYIQFLVPLFRRMLGFEPFIIGCLKMKVLTSCSLSYFITHFCCWICQYIVCFGKLLKQVGSTGVIRILVWMVL